jgi:hypothetical protein
MAKVTRTKAAPKAAPKTAKMDKSQVEKYLAKVPEKYVFWSCDGRVLRDMNELKEALAVISDQTFAYHANDSKNDFATWVKDIIGDEKLASDLQNVVNREQAGRIVEERCLFLTNQPG